MPSDKEIQESGVPVYGTIHLSNPCKLGEIAVVKFYDHVDEVAAAYERGYDKGVQDTKPTDDEFVRQFIQDQVRFVDRYFGKGEQRWRCRICMV